VLTERAIDDSEVEGDPVPYLLAALKELSTGIATMDQGTSPASKLHLERADCYRRLAESSKNAEEKKRYRKLAQKDKDDAYRGTI